MSSIIACRQRLTPIIGGQGTVDRRLDAFRQEAHTAVAKEEITTARVQTAEAADEIAAGAVVATWVGAIDRRRDQAAIHRLVARVGTETVLGRDAEHRAIPRVRGIADACRAPRLLHANRLTGQVRRRPGG